MDWDVPLEVPPDDVEGDKGHAEHDQNFISPIKSPESRKETVIIVNELFVIMRRRRLISDRVFPSLNGITLDRYRRSLSVVMTFVLITDCRRFDKLTRE